VLRETRYHAHTCTNNCRVRGDHETPGLSLPVNGINGNNMIADQDLVRSRGRDRSLLQDKVVTDGREKGCNIWFGHCELDTLQRNGSRHVEMGLTSALCGSFIVQGRLASEDESMEVGGGRQRCEFTLGESHRRPNWPAPSRGPHSRRIWPALSCSHRSCRLRLATGYQTWRPKS